MKLGIIGAGSIVPFHLKALKEVGFEPYAISATKNSPHINQVANQFKIKNAYDNHLRLFESGIEALLIASSSPALEEIFYDSLNYDFPTLIEKPLFLNSTKLDKETLFKSRNYVVGYNRRFYSSTEKMRHFIENSGVGSFSFRIPEISWKSSSESTEKIHALKNNTVHSLDLVNYLFNKENKTNKFSINSNNNSDKYLLLDFEDSRFNGQIQITFNSPAGYLLNAFIEGKYAQLQPLEIFTEYEAIEVVEPDDESPIRRYLPVEKPDYEGIGTFDLRYKPGFYAQAKEFYSMANGGVRIKSATVEQASNLINFVDELSAALLRFAK